MADKTGEQIYSWLKSQADGDGMVLATSMDMARSLNRPKSTVTCALQRLQKRGRICLLTFSPGKAQYVIVDDTI